MSEAQADPQAPEDKPRCPLCYSYDVKQLSPWQPTFECADCRLIFDLTNSNQDFPMPNDAGYEDDKDWSWM